jgi:hypothetical protein
MGRSVFGVIVFVSLSAAVPARADVETWHPKPIFTDGHCAQELAGGLAALKEKLAAEEITDPGEDSKDKAAVKAYVKALKRADAKTRKRARVQASAAGKWKGKTRYASYKWKHKTYRLTSCQPAKIKIPLARALRVVTAIAEPT